MRLLLSPIAIGAKKLVKAVLYNYNRLGILILNNYGAKSIAEMMTYLMVEFF